MFSYLSATLGLLCPTSYILVFLGMMIEGEIVLLVSSFLAYQGIFQWQFVLPAIILGVFIGDSLWFSLGAQNCSVSKTIKPLADKAVKYLKIEDMLFQNPFLAIFISKFLYGLNHLIIVKAADSGMKFRDFIKINTMAAIIWVILISGLGYFFGASFLSFKKIVKWSEFAILGFIIIFPFFERIVSGLIFKIIKKRAAK